MSSTTSTGTPTYVYKIVPASSPPPNPLPERLLVSDLDEKDGFLHLSTAKQVPRTLNAFFGKDQKAYLLRIVYKDLDLENVKWENHAREQGKEGEEGFFPHLYNGNTLGKNEVESVKEVERAQPDASWGDALAELASTGWFTY